MADGADDRRVVSMYDRATELAPGGPRAKAQGCVCSVLANAAYRAGQAVEPSVDPRCRLHAADWTVCRTVFDAVGTTARLVHELGHVDPGRPQVRYAEIATMLRLAGDVAVDGGSTTVRAEFGSPEAATRLRDGMAALFGCEPTVETTAGRAGALRCTVHVTAPGADLARATGMVDRAVRPTVGAPSLLTGTASAVAIWRGALLARGGISRPRGRLQVQVACPGQAAALTLVDAAHWLGLPARDRETAAEHRVLVRDPDGVDTLLRTVGALGVALALREQRIPEPRPCADPA